MRWRGFRLQAPELDAELRIRGLVQADAVFLIDDDNEQNNRFEIRRGRIAISGKIGRFFGFRVEPQFTPGNVVLLDAYVDARLVDDALVLRAGKMKTPLGIEMLQSVSVLILPERGLSTSLVPNRDIGVQFLGELGDGLFDYAIGVFGGAPDRATPDGNVDDNVDLAGRVFVQPFHTTSMAALRNVGIGLAGSWGIERGAEADSGLARYRTVTRDTYARYEDGVVADGQRFRINPQLWWYWGPLGVLGEYVYSAQRVRSDSAVQTLGNQAWTVGASYVLTQEDATYGGVAPSRPWGAFELAGRYGELHFDEQAFTQGFLSASRPSVVRAWGVALNYWANAVVRAQVAFEQTRFEAYMGEARSPENALFTRLQVSL